MESIFWVCLVLVIYAYFLYPGVLFVLGRLMPKRLDISQQDFYPSVSLIIPVYNEAAVIEAKLRNLDELLYPRDQLKIIIVSDGSTDETVSIISQFTTSLDIQIVPVTERQGKANALNTGLEKVTSDLVVFSDASIMLDKGAIKNIVKPFEDLNIGCVSGEDHIAESGGEGFYGKYELFLRNQESLIGSIVGASGSFYAQRADLCMPFEGGLAPDFLSVLNTVANNYRAITEPSAYGYMNAVKSSSHEFQRKVRTLLRGMTALFAKAKLLNPFTYGLFSFFLISHKLMRWLVPFFLLAILIANIFLLDQVGYQLLFSCQVLFYGLAIIANVSSLPLHNSLIGKIPLFFCMVNLAIAQAWLQYLRGERQELWEPSKRTPLESK